MSFVDCKEVSSETTNGSRFSVGCSSCVLCQSHAAMTSQTCRVNILKFRLESFLRRARRGAFLQGVSPTFKDMAARADSTLFGEIIKPRDTKLFFATSVTTPPRFSVWFKILYRV